MLPIKLWQIRNQAVAIIIISLTVVMGGCDRDALFEQMQSSTSAEPIEQKFPDLASDVYDSCLRAAKYNPLQAVDLCPNY